MKRFLVLFLALFAFSAYAGSSFTGIDKTTTGLTYHFSNGDVTVPQTTSGVSVMKPRVCAKSANYTVTDTDGCDTILVTTGSSTIVITLPSAANNAGRTLLMKKADAGSGQLRTSRSGSDTIEGATTTDIGEGSSNQYGFLKLVSNGVSTWLVLGVNSEYVENTRSSPLTVVVGNSGVFFSIDSGNTTFNDGNETGISLPPGKWDIQGVASFSSSTGITITEEILEIGTAPGNSQTGVDTTRGQFRLPGSVTNSVWNVSTPVWRVNITSATTYYLKARSNHTGGSVTVTGNLRAVRVP